jgi:hypothetical protein
MGIYAQITFEGSSIGDIVNVCVRGWRGACRLCCLCQKGNRHHALFGHRTSCKKRQEDKKVDDSDTGV